jgi:DNA polymerase-4
MKVADGDVCHHKAAMSGSGPQGGLRSTTPTTELVMLNRSIFFLRIPSFGIAVERACRPKLAQRPLALAPPDSARALVQEVSAEARAAGIRPGMRLNEARRLCRDLTVLYPNPALCARAEAALLRVLRQFTPLVEPFTNGSAYLDVTSSVRLFGGADTIAQRAEREISGQLRLDPSAGLGLNKLVSLVAGKQSPPREFISVQAGSERDFLAPLKVHVLPAVDRKLYGQLRELNFQVVQQVAQIEPTHLEAAFGRRGLVLHRQALGQDSSPVQPPSAVPHLTKRSELAEDSNDLVVLKRELFGLVEESLAELRLSGRSAKRLQIDLLYSDFKSARGVRTLREASNLLSLWYAEAEALFLKILERRIRVRTLEARFEGFQRDVGAQLGLFETPRDSREQRLTQSLDKVRERFGVKAVSFAK